MNANVIKEIIMEYSENSRWLRGLFYNKNKLVLNTKIKEDKGIITFSGAVESDYQNSLYSNSVVLNISDKKIISTRCDCDDYKSKSRNNPAFLCKHLIATSLNCIDKIKDFNLNVENVNDIYIVDNEFIDIFSEDKKQETKLDVNITYIKDSQVRADFKIGIDKLYVLKNIRDFANVYYDETNIQYGKGFIYNFKNNYFNECDDKIIDLVVEYGLSLSTYGNSSAYKYMELNSVLLKKMMYLLRDKEFTFTYAQNNYKPKVIMNDLPIEFNLKKVEDKIKLSVNDGLPIPMSKKGDVLFYEGNIYIISKESGMYYKNIYDILIKYNYIMFEKNQIEKVLTDVVSKLSLISNNLHIDDDIKSNICDEVNVGFYFDVIKDKLLCNIKFTYKGYEKGKFIIRDIKRETEAKQKIKSLGFKESNNKFIFNSNDEKLYEFLRKDMRSLRELGSIYYSERFKKKRIHKNLSIKANITPSVGGYLDFSFEIDDVEAEEHKNILKAIKDKKKFYKLKNGDFIDLNNKQTNEFFNLVDNLDIVENNKIHQSKSLYLDEIIKQNDFDFIDGRDYIKEINEKFSKRDNIHYDIPNNLNAKLRDYQVEGYNWYLNLDHYGFGGILADEMGLGKTLQTISFLLSQKGKKTLIISPTSLIHNWKYEFAKFAPSMDVCIIHGSKDERKVLLDNHEDYDVIITTYKTIINDLDIYESKEFDYCIIDEAQNIKNISAISTFAVKSINSKLRFAITGTPIENNLLELWSIFDFIMPGYLNDKNKFIEQFISNENNIYLLKKLIEPFILRRTKKEVMKELPDKIEKKFIVELSQNQREIYKEYVDDIRVELQKENKDKITILSYLTKLRQLCLDPKVVLDDYEGESTKTDICVDMIKKYIQDDKKILIFSQFTSVLKNLGERLQNEDIVYSYLDGKTKPIDRINMVDEFNQRDDIKVFLISLKAGGVGLNLTSANVVIHFDPWWNPAVENQATDRAHRFGQTEIVEVVKLIAKGTIEEKIDILQSSKRKLVENIIDNNLSNSNTLSNLSYDEIIDLFT